MSCFGTGTTSLRSVINHRCVNDQYGFSNGEDQLANEVPVALVYNGVAYTVMMCSPEALDDFALGFSLAEGIVQLPSDIYGIEIANRSNGIELAITISNRRQAALVERRRTLAGRTGCGLCGSEQLNQVVRDLSPLPNSQQFALSHLDSLLASTEQAQLLHSLTGSTHAALWFAPEGELLGVREDVGRHVALDKLIGLRANQAWQDGVLLITSRASFEMVQKAAAVGIEIVLAISAATTMAVKLADQCNLSLAGFCRNGRATIYTGQHRFT